MPYQLRFRLAADALSECFSPAIERAVDGEDSEWTATLRRQAAKFEKRAWPSPLWLPFRAWRRTGRHARRAYERRWTSESSLSRLDLGGGAPAPVVWGSRRYFAHVAGIKRVHLLYLIHLIDDLKPTRVLEVGSGMGHNLFILAARFPETAFCGIELTDAGTGVAESIRAEEHLPDALGLFSPVPVRDTTAHKRVELHQGNAANLPFSDGRFDLVYTVQALEQMDLIRHRVLREIARTSAGLTAMIEPFADWNESPARRNRIRAFQFFSASIADLEQYGLRPVFVSDDMPTKAHYGVGLVIAETMAAAGAQ